MSRVGRWWDHHVHLLATAAARCSVDVSTAPDIDAVCTVLGAATGRGWLRAWGYDDAFLTERRHPTRLDLDGALSRPAVLHHRTGHVVVLNGAALREIGLGDHPDGVLVERHDVLGRVPRLPVGRLEAAAASVSADWESRGVGGFTDATHTNGAAELALLAEWSERGIVRQRMSAMVGIDHVDVVGRDHQVGALPVVAAKVMPRVDERDDLDAAVRRGHGAGFGVSVHVTDIETLDRTLTAFEASAPPGGRRDRIEHCSLCLPEQVERIAATGATVVVNPSFLVHRAAKYRRELSVVEQSWLVRIRSLRDAGVKVLAGSDSPVVPADPEEMIAAAADHPFSPTESLGRSGAEFLLRGVR